MLKLEAKNISKFLGPLHLSHNHSGKDCDPPEDTERTDPADFEHFPGEWQSLRSV